jgi:hypothetical protein
MWCGNWECETSSDNGIRLVNFAVSEICQECCSLSQHSHVPFDFWQEDIQKCLDTSWHSSIGVSVLFFSFIYSLIDDPFNNSDYIVSNDKTVSKQCNRKDLEGSICDIILGMISAYSWINWGKARQLSLVWFQFSTCEIQSPRATHMTLTFNKCTLCYFVWRSWQLYSVILADTGHYPLVAEIRKRLSACK